MLQGGDLPDGELSVLMIRTDGARSRGCPAVPRYLFLATTTLFVLPVRFSSPEGQEQAHHANRECATQRGSNNFATRLSMWRGQQTPCHLSPQSICRQEPFWAAYLTRFDINTGVRASKTHTAVVGAACCCVIIQSFYVILKDQPYVQPT